LAAGRFKPFASFSVVYTRTKNLVANANVAIGAMLLIEGENRPNE